MVALASGALLLRGHPWDGPLIAAALDRRVQRGALLASTLRGAIGLLTLALVVLGASLAA